MKVAYVLMQYPAPTETFASRDIKALNKLGAALEVFNLRRPHRHHLRMASERQLDLQTIHSPSILGYIYYFFYGLLFYTPSIFRALLKVKCPTHFFKTLILIPRSIEIAEKIMKEKFDLVHAFWGHYPSLVLFFLKEKQSKVKTTLFLGAYDLLLEYPISRWVALQSDTCFTHAKVNIPTLESVYQIPKSLIKVVYRGISPPQCVQDRKKDWQLVTVGRLIPEKGGEHALRTFSSLRKKLGKGSLHICGDGPDRERLYRIAQELNITEHVVFRGHLSESEIFDTLSESQALIFLSTKGSERLPNVIKEAFFSKCAVLSSESPGIDELIDPMSAGFVVKSPESYEENAQALIELVHSENFETKLNYSKNKIEKHFFAENSMKEYLQVWQQLRQK